MLCCLFIATAAAPLGAWMIGPQQPSCCGVLRMWTMPLALAFGLALMAAAGSWLVIWLLVPGLDVFQPICRMGVWIAGAV